MGDQEDSRSRIERQPVPASLEDGNKACQTRRMRYFVTNFRLWQVPQRDNGYH